MIVHSTSAGWEIVFHRSHALLAAQIALQWDGRGRIERVAETIAAIAQHDDLEREFEGDHLTDAGAPMDFTERPQDDAAELPRWEEMLELALYRSRWVALLTATHICFLNADKPKKTAKMQKFLDELEAKIETWRKELGIDKEAAQASYAFMQWCDRLSLILSMGELPSRERWLEISNGPDGVRYDIFATGEPTKRYVSIPGLFRRTVSRSQWMSAPCLN